MKVQVAYADAHCEAIAELEVTGTCSVREAVMQSGLPARIPVPQEDLGYAIYGRRVDAGALLSPGDRVDITRPLARDAKAARRARAAQSR
jgi:putative ubiquitin-RnfH superfamily antitoxin RatB of RatAB toxin-antitoxin module